MFDMARAPDTLPYALRLSKHLRTLFSCSEYPVVYRILACNVNRYKRRPTFNEECYVNAVYYS